MRYFLHVVLFLLLVFFTACTIRMGAFAPRLPDLAQHHNVTNTDCLKCHELQDMTDHKASDNCLRCHHLVKGV